MSEAFKPGEEIRGRRLGPELDDETRSAVERAIRSMDPRHLDTLIDNPEFLDKIARKLKSRGPMTNASGQTMNGFSGSPLGERMREQIDLEEDVNLQAEDAVPRFDSSSIPTASDDADSQFWQAPAPPQPNVRIPPKPAGYWQPTYPPIPRSNDPRYGLNPQGRGMGGTSAVGQGSLLLVGIIAGLGILALRLLGKKENGVSLITEEESAAARNPGEGGAEVSNVDLSAEAIFPYPKSLSLGRNQGSMYKGDSE